MNINLKLTLDEVNVILNALGTGVYNTVAPVVTKIREQALPQVEGQQSADSKGTTDAS